MTIRITINGFGHYTFNGLLQGFCHVSTADEGFLEWPGGYELPGVNVLLIDKRGEI